MNGHYTHEKDAQHYSYQWGKYKFNPQGDTILNPANYSIKINTVKSFSSCIKNLQIKILYDDKKYFFHYPLNLTEMTLGTVIFC